MMAKLSSSTRSQHTRLLNYLKENKHANTLEIREKLSILGVAVRISELKEKGNDIVTHFITVETANSKHYGIADYYLMSLAQEVKHD